MDDSVRSHFGIAMAARRHGDRAYARQEAEALLSWQTTSLENRRQILLALRELAEPLKNLAPSTSWRKVSFDTLAGWPLLNPTIAADGDGFLMVVRSSTYPLEQSPDPANGIGLKRWVRSQNFLVRLDNDLNIMDCQPILEHRYSDNTVVTGMANLEDCRIFPRRDGWQVSATAYDLHPNERAQQVIADLEGHHLTNVRLISDQRAKRWEKNWMPFVQESQMRLVRWLSPLEIITVDPRGKKLQSMMSGEPVPIGVDLLGGSQFIPFGSGWLGLAHHTIRVPEPKRLHLNQTRSYMHRFVYLDEQLNFAGVSDAFHFLHEGIEFCAGLVKDGKRLIASVGIDDRAAFLVTLDATEVRAMLRPVRKPRRPISEPRPRNTQPRIGALILAENDGADVVSTIKSVSEFVDFCLVLSPAPLPVGSDSVVMEEYPLWTNPADARNYGMSRLAHLGADWVLLLEAGEKVMATGGDLAASLASSSSIILRAWDVGVSRSSQRLIDLGKRPPFASRLASNLPEVRETTGVIEELQIVPAPKLPHDLAAARKRVSELANHLESELTTPLTLEYVDALIQLDASDDSINRFNILRALSSVVETEADPELAAWSAHRAGSMMLEAGQFTQALEFVDRGIHAMPEMAELATLGAQIWAAIGDRDHASFWAKLAATVAKSDQSRRLYFRDLEAARNFPQQILDEHSAQQLSLRGDCDIPLVSIVITNYDAANKIGTAIESALNQTWSNCEVIVVDDGSTDSSHEVIGVYGDQITAIFKPNGGQGSAINAGFAASSGEALLFLDGDDWLTPDAVEAAMPELMKRAVSKVQWRMWQVHEGEITADTFPAYRLASGDVLPASIDRGPLTHGAAPTSANLWRRSWLEDVMPIPEEAFRDSADIYLFTLAPIFGEIVTLPGIHGHYRFAFSGLNGRSTAQNESRLWEVAAESLRSSLEKNFGLKVDIEQWRQQNNHLKRMSAMVKAGSEIDQAVPEDEAVAFVSRGPLDRLRPSIGRTSTLIWWKEDGEPRLGIDPVLLTDLPSLGFQYLALPEAELQPHEQVDRIRNTIPPDAVVVFESPRVTVFRLESGS